MRRKNKKPNKSQCERIHAQKRAMERYGLEYKRIHLDLIRNGIRNQEVMLLFRITNRVSLRLWKYEDKDIYLLYDHNRQEVVTFLTKEMAEKML